MIFKVSELHDEGMRPMVLPLAEEPRHDNGVRRCLAQSA
jgi:hypothetical protein